MRIDSKKKNYVLYEAGAYGNKFRTWDSVTAAYDAAADGSLPPEIVMRYKGSMGGAQYRGYGQAIPSESVTEYVSDWVEAGADESLIVFNEAAPDERLVIQGEVMRGLRGLELRYSRMKARMRTAMAEDSHRLTGALAGLTLRQAMTPASYYDITDLLDLYEGHVVEFSTYEMCLGDCRGRNTVVWEVRDY